MKLMRIDTYLLKLLFLLAAGIVVCQMLGRSSITSLLFYATFPVTVLLWLRTVRKTATGMDLLMLLTIVLALVSILLDAWFNNAGLGFAYVKKVIIFCMTLIFLQTAFRLRINREMVDFINTVVDLLTICLIYMFFAHQSQMHILHGRISGYLTFRVGNPNLTSLYLSCLYMLELYRIFTPERWYWKLTHILMSVCLLMFIFLTRSRSCLIAVLLFTANCAWLVFKGRRKLYIKNSTAWLIAVFPVIFVAVYIFLVYMPWVQDLLEFLVSEGKKLDSRMRIWEPALRYLANSPLIGAYYHISDGTGMSQMHNSHLDVAASYGIPVLAMVCLLLRNYLHQGGRHYGDKQGYIYILGFAAAILLGIGEAALFSGGLSIYIFVGAFLLLANREEAAQTMGKL